jgi:hypothetical protein
LDQFEIGDLVSYVPYHAKGNIHHKDVEQGVVSSTRKTEDGIIVFVRFGNMENSQGCRPSQLVKL